MSWQSCKKKEEKKFKNIFQSGSQSLIIAKKCFFQVKSFTRQQNKTDQSIRTISMAGQTGAFKIQPRILFFSLSEMLTTQLKVYTDQNVQSEVVPLETTQTRLVSDRNITFILQ